MRALLDVSRRLRLAGAVALVAVALVAGALTPASADDAEKKKAVDQKVSAAQKELTRSAAAVDKAAKALATAKTEIPKAQSVLREARGDLAAAELAEQRMVQALAEAQAKVDAEQAKVDQVLNAMETSRTVIATIARSVYTQGPYAELEVVLESQDPGDFAERLQSVRTVVTGQNQALSGLAEQRADLQARQAELEVARGVVAERRAQAREQREAASAATARAAQAKARIDRLVAQRESAVRVADREKAATLRQLDALEKEQDRLAGLLAAAARSRGNAAGYPSGSLQWPVPGSFTGGVGPRIHPVYGYASCHTGIDIGAPTGTPIKAAAAGTVVAIRSGGPYGLHTVIDHGGGLATMYAHQSAFGVSTGQSVAKAEVIGFVGSTGFSTGPHLHFEVWVGGQPHDPMGWFGGTRKPVSC